MQVTIGICTWNRCSLLSQTLEQLTNLVIPDGIEWEVLVVDNNSTDSTKEVTESFAANLPLRYIFEPNPGKSHALNTASKIAAGEYILWTDDDALVDPGWMTSYCEAFQRHPGAGFFGGPVEPWFEGSPPLWVKRCLSQIGPIYAIRDFGEQPFLFSEEIKPYGVNWAVERKKQLRYPYDPSLGRQPGRFIGGEETAIMDAMLGAGIEGWWVPGARVRHYAPRVRQSTNYIRKFYFGEGELWGQESVHDGAMLFRAPRFLWRQAITAELKYRFRRYLSDPSIWIEDLKLSAFDFGAINAWRSRRP
jgi:glycosyltransferase involved in cell wall biosynthesis